MRTRWLSLVLALAIAILLASFTWVGLFAQQGGSEPISPDSANPSTVIAVIGDDPDEDGYSGPVQVGSSAEPWSEEYIDLEASTGRAADSLQPDDNGYIGPLYQNDPGILVASEIEPVAAVDWDALIQGPQPDQDVVNTPEDWSTFYYMFVAGSTMRPRDSQAGWDYHGGGCISAYGAFESFTIHLDLPQGSRVDYVRIYYYDTSVSNSQAWLTAYNGEGSLEDLAYVTSSGDAGYGTQLTGYIGHVVDNSSHAYVLNWNPQLTGSAMQLCGLRVAYRLWIP